MEHKKIFFAGIIGTLVALLCYATPLLAVLLGIVGFGTITSMVDSILVPMLAIFLGVTFFAYNKRRKSTGKNDSCCS